MDCKKQYIQEQSMQIDGNRIKIARAEKGWTISRLADQSGVTRKTISEIEKGQKKKIRYATLQYLANTLNKKEEYFCSHIENVVKEGN